MEDRPIVFEACWPNCCAPFAGRTAAHKGNMTTFYRDSEPTLRHGQVWFPIQHGDNSRYIHAGNISDGCVTVLDLARWAAIHEALISHRAPDGRSVATLTVRGTPERSR
jgi:hypothetical protein